jgi:hypothetical protein
MIRNHPPGSSCSEDKQRVLDAVARTLPVLEREPLAKRLWVVEEDRIRIRA